MKKCSYALGSCSQRCLIYPRVFKFKHFTVFCQSLLGRFPLEAGMAPGFEGVDEAEARDLMAGAKDQMLAATRKPRNKDLQDALSDVAKLVTETLSMK